MALEENFNHLCLVVIFFFLPERGMWGEVYFHIKDMHISFVLFILTVINVKIRSR